LKHFKYSLLILGILSPFLALILYVLVYNLLIAVSRNIEKDWLFRLSVSAAVMFIPFLVVVWMAIKERREKQLRVSGMIGVAIATLSLGLVLKPVSDGVTRWKQTKNMAMRDVEAPLFDTVDLSGNEQRLADQKGKVVLIDIWATWCSPCRAEMPKLDHLYEEKKAQGLVVYGLSDENPDVQRKFLQRVPVGYPLLTVKGTIPSLYREIVRYPAMFLVDRNGKLQPAPAAGQPFEKTEAAVTALLQNQNSPATGDAAR
jgi:cytochrome c biogenesis protein CcmG, thiol:disulfide interchange protein DsbE